MKFSGNLLILEKDSQKRQSLETIFSFLGLVCQSGDAADCLSYFEAEDANVDYCVLGDVDSLDCRKLLKEHKDTAFLLCTSKCSEDLS